MTTELVRASIDDKPVLRNLLQLYHYDFSEWTGDDVNAHGEFTHPYLDHYWTDPHSHPFLIRRSRRWAGLVLVRTLDVNDVAEFFVLRKYRRTGVGREAARETFALFPGKWQVRQLRANRAAIAFWRSVVPADHVETSTDDEIVQHFTMGHHGSISKSSGARIPGAAGAASTVARDLAHDGRDATARTQR